MTKNSIFSILLLAGWVTSLSASTISIPFQLAGKLIIVQATVDGQTGNFILDTGIPYLVLNARYFEGEPGEKTFYGVNGSAGKVQTLNTSLAMSTINLKNVPAEIIPLEHLAQLKGIAIYGLLGAGLFQDYELLIDLQHMEIKLYELDRKGENTDTRESSLPSEVLSFKCKGRTPVIEVQIGETSYKVTFDTGAEINLFHEKYKEKLQAYLLDQQEKNMSDFAIETKQGTVSKLTDLVIGHQLCRPMKTFFKSIDDLNSTVTGPIVDGIVGFEILRQFRVSINFKKKEMYLWKYDPPVKTILAAGKN